MESFLRNLSGDNLFEIAVSNQQKRGRDFNPDACADKRDRAGREDIPVVPRGRKLVRNGIPTTRGARPMTA
jgi:hypothetical protein